MALEYYLMGELPTKQTTIKGHLEGAAPAEAAPDGTKYFDADTGIEWTRFNGAWTRGLGGLSVREIDLSAAITPAHPVVESTNTTPTITGDTCSITCTDEYVNAVFSFGPEEAASGRVIWSPHNHSAGGLNGMSLFDNGEEAYTYFYQPGSGLMAAPPAPASPVVVDADFEPGDYVYFASEAGDVIWGTSNIPTSTWPGSGHAFTVRLVMGVSAPGDTVTATITTLLDVIELPPEVASVLADYAMTGEGAAVELPEDAAVGELFRVTAGGQFNGITYASPDGNNNSEGFILTGTDPLSVVVVKAGGGGGGGSAAPVGIDLSNSPLDLPSVPVGTRFLVTEAGYYQGVEYQKGEMFTLVDAESGQVNEERGQSFFAPGRTTGLVNSTGSSFQIYATDPNSNATTLNWPTIKENVVKYPSTGKNPGIVNINAPLDSLKVVKVMLDNDLVTWVFSGTLGGSRVELDIEIIQGATPKACMSPASAGRTAGGAWTVSNVANSRQRLKLFVDEVGGVDLFPYPVLS